MCVCVGGVGDGGGEEEEEVVLKNDPLIFNRGIRKDIPDLLFHRFHLHLKHSIAFGYSLMFNLCVCACALLSKWTQMSSLIV